MKKLIERVEEFWCVNMHGKPMWPYRGRYVCRVCHREFPVRFERAEEDAGRPHETAFATAAIVARRA
jgi:hypothetical protein